MLLSTLAKHCSMATELRVHDVCVFLKFRTVRKGKLQLNAVYCLHISNVPLFFRSSCSILCIVIDSVSTDSISCDFFVLLYHVGDTMTVQDPDEMDLCTVMWTVVAYCLSEMEEMLPR